LDDPRPGSWTVAVNNHVDVDGILSVYALVHSGHALAHRQTIVQAAEMGDFWGWGEPPAQRVFQGVTRLMEQGDDPQEIYAEAFRRIPGLIDGSDPDVARIESSLAPLREGVELVRRGRIVRREIDARLAQYVMPLAVAGDDDARASYVPEFNEAISSKALLWPQVRAYWDAERVCLVSVERKTGWFHDLWFPGYYEGMSRYDLQNDRLIAAFEQLQQTESAPGRWVLGGTRPPFDEKLQEQFPLVGPFLYEEGQASASGLSPDQVAWALEGVFG
jgi:hypothetical protein